VVLFLTSILRTDKLLKMSVIHRAMQECWQELAADLCVEVKGCCVSYSQLKRIIRSIDVESFNTINAEYFGSTVAQQGQQWKSIDGKELCGSIDGALGEKRGQSVVSLTAHQGGQSEVVGYYDGTKESERPAVTAHFEQVGPLRGGYSFDALHTFPRNLELIDQRGGVYLAQVKGNQQVLLEDCRLIDQHPPAEYSGQKTEKGHGRVETRRARGYGLDKSGLAERWKDAGIASLLVVERERYNTKTQKQSCETAYWVSNQVIDEQKFVELTEAARRHWAVEVHHYVRDVQMGEDKMVIRNANEARVMAGFITTATNMLVSASQDQSISEIRERLTRNQALVDPLFKRK